MMRGLRRVGEPVLPIPALSGESRGWADPDDWTLSPRDAALATRPGERIGTASLAARPRYPAAAHIASGLLHLALAVTLVGYAADDVLIEGGEMAQVALLGNAPEDQLASGSETVDREFDVTSVTIVTMLDARPVTTEAEAVPPEPLTDTVERVEPEPAMHPEPVASERAVSAETITADTPETFTASAATAARPVEAEPTEPAQAAANPLPEVLTAQTLTPEATDTVAPVVQSLTEVAPDAVVTETPARVPAERPVDTAEPEPVRPVEPGAVIAALPEEVAKPEPERAKPVKRQVEPKSEKPQPTKRETKPEKARQKQADKTKAKADKKQAAAEKAREKAGSGGRNVADARKGSADGAADGKSASAKGSGKKNTAAGNAAVTNYPGKVASKLRRALRYPAEAKRQGLRGEAHVSFTVSAGGGLSGVRLARSSGSPVLDKAALETVRRAAPFPAIPKEAGRSSWAFTVPLAFAR